MPILKRRRLVRADAAEAPKRKKGDLDMDFLLSHWHCVVPMILIGAVLLLKGRGKKNHDGE
jgi:hypothetical protein